MKFAIFTFLLIAISCWSAVSAEAESRTLGLCDTNQCGYGQVCICADGKSNCVLLNDCADVAIAQTIETSWVENNIHYTHYKVHIYNYGKRTINQIAIQTDCTLNPRDQYSVWNIVYSNGFFMLPTYGKGIAPGQEFVFGFIDIGTRSPNMFIRAINYQ